MPAEPWSIKERLTLEKSALGFYLSGHLFEQARPRCDCSAKRRIADLVDRREPQLLAGIVGDLRVVNGQRGRVAIFKLDDGSEYIEAVANEELLEANRELLRDDELVIVQGKVQPDRFTGGLRLNVNQLWDLPAARARFGSYLAVAVNGKAPPVADVHAAPGRQGAWPPTKANCCRACACVCSCERQPGRPSSTLATPRASGPVTRPWRAGGHWPTRGGRQSFTIEVQGASRSRTGVVCCH